MASSTQSATPFRAGAVVIATLANPREKFWGAILHLSTTGLSLRGVDLSSFDDFISQIRSGEPFAAGVMFFPMHRLEPDRDYPLNLSISISGGKETNKDSLSNGE